MPNHEKEIDLSEHVSLIKKILEKTADKCAGLDLEELENVLTALSEED